MIKHNRVNEQGAISALLIGLIASILIGLGVAGFAVWATMERADYKNNVDEKIAAAVVIAKAEEASNKDKVFAEEYKKPFTMYTGPDSYGSIRVMYPKTWSGYVDSTDSSGALLDGYFNPGVVPSVESENSVFALRIRVLSQGYKESLIELAGLQQDAKLTVEPYALPKVPEQVGVKATGMLADNKSGVAVYLPLRDKTLLISTEGNQFLNDFNNIILPNLTFSP